MLTDYTLDLVNEKVDDPDDRQWVLDMLEGLKIQMDNPPDTWLYNADEPHTQQQVGYLAGLMDLAYREDRLEMVSILVGYEAYYDGEEFPNYVPLEDLPEDKRYLYPGPSSKDCRITRWQHSVLIDYYLNNPEAHKLHEYLGYESLSTQRQKERIARQLARQAKAAQLAIDKERRKQEREAKRLLKLGNTTG